VTLGAGGEHLAAAVIADLDILQPRLARQRGELGVGVEVAETGQRLRGWGVSRNSGPVV
jgi:hypothetical protein